MRVPVLAHILLGALAIFLAAAALFPSSVFAQDPRVRDQQTLQDRQSQYQESQGQQTQTQQSIPDAPVPNTDDASPQAHPIVAEQPPSRYQPPTEGMKLQNFLFDTVGPYPLLMTTVISGYHQARHTPPDWREGFAGYGMRYGSDFGTNFFTVTTRYALGEAFHQDTLYYRCACRGIWPRLQHALAATVIAHSGDDGHKVPALPALVAPYAGSLTAVSLWYPARYSAKDAFRMGNYGLMDYAIGNISLEFLPDLMHSRANSKVTRFHLDNRHAARKGESAP